MSPSKPMVVARADLKMAFKVKYVKYSMIFLGGLGPAIATLMIVGIAAAVPASSSDYAIIMSLMVPTAASLLAMMAVIPASMIAANTLVGEREQKTLEPLLCTPLTDRELLLGKTLGSVLPSLVLLVAGTAVTSVAVNVGLSILGRPPMLFPDLPGLFLILAVGPVVLVSVVSVMILVSSRVRRVYEAYQTGGTVILILMIPMFIVMTQMESATTTTGIVWIVDIVTFLIAAILAAITWALVLKQFNRDYMVSLV